MTNKIQVFSRGTAYPLWIALALICAGFATAIIFVPVIFNLQVTSVYEYLEMRYSAFTPKNDLNGGLIFRKVFE